MTLGSTGAGTVQVALEPGVRTTVCAYVDPQLSGEQLNLPEARNCRVLVFIP